ncbi:hypothetical protein VNO78_34512 [Psophocarpus tetragonolobus]|uniref:Uncharacterized protein n=1 Tax=Psophocarpus tetragonolobus TaxID=3891 RepID=A0AAN9NU48_PSOTE
MLSCHYIQKGLLFKKPSPLLNEQDFIENLLEKLKHSLSLALFHFYPLSGCLIHCHDIISPIDVLAIVQTLFDHHKAVNHDGHTMPLLSVQVTELVDGIFIGCSMNHTVGDGTSYWNFLNTWSEIFQAHGHCHEHGDVPISHPPIHNCWFPEGCAPLINLPFKYHDEFISRYETPLVRERMFHFSAESIAKLKAKANKESNTTQISSFQSLSALVWRCITRASHRAVLQSLKEWLESPLIYQFGRYFDPYCVVMSSSPRFNMYGNEFGMGKAVVVRSGYANKFDGKVMSYPSYEGGGGVDLEVCLSPIVMSVLESDQEFMNAVSVCNHLY